MSGVYGHKPSFGIVPAHGQIPGPPGTLTQADIAVAGPMARTTADLALGLDLMSGPDRWNAPAWRLELPPPRATDLPRLRVATWFVDEACPLDPEVATTLDGFVDRLGSAGCRVEREVTPGFTLAKVNERFQALVTAAVSGGFTPGQIEEFALASGDDPVSVARLQSSMRHRQWLSHHEGRLQLRRRFEAFFEDHDILLLPVMPCVAIHHDHSEPMAARVVSTQPRSAPVLGDQPLDGPGRRLLPAGDGDPGRDRRVGTAGRGADRRAVPPRPHHARVRRRGGGDPRPVPDAARLRRLSVAAAAAPAAADAAQGSTSHGSISIGRPCGVRAAARAQPAR